jgi:hypothetical protein
MLAYIAIGLCHVRDDEERNEDVPREIMNTHPGGRLAECSDEVVVIYR